MSFFRYFFKIWRLNGHLDQNIGSKQIFTRTSNFKHINSILIRVRLYAVD